MKDRDIVFWGAGGQASVLENLASSIGYRLVGLFTDEPAASSSLAPVISGDWQIREWLDGLDGTPKFAIAIGGSHGAARLDKFERLSQLGLKSVTLIHPTAILLSDRIGDACQLLAGSILGVNACLGRGVIVNTAASIDHDSYVGSGSHVGPGARITGRVNVGKNVFLGAGSVICPDVSITDNVIVGAGSVVVSNIETPGLFVGVPARKIR